MTGDARSAIGSAIVRFVKMAPTSFDLTEEESFDNLEDDVNCFISLELSYLCEPFFIAQTLSSEYLLRQPLENILSRLVCIIPVIQ